MDRWDHASLLPAGLSPAKALEERSIEPSELDTSEPTSEPGSPLAEGWGLLDVQTFRSQLKPAIKHSGWLLKASGGGPQRQWRRRYVYVLADRLCYTPDPGAGEASPVRYLPMDRIPMRALPRGYGPKLGVTVVEDRQVDRSSPDFSPKKAGCVFSLACGAHTHFFAAASPAEAKGWVEVITRCWVACMQHTARGAHHPSAEEGHALKQAHLQAENRALRRSLAEAEQQRLRDSMAQWQAAAAAATVQTVHQEGLPVACYEIEVETGGHPDAGTTARVYLELCGAAGTSGDHRLMYAAEGPAPPAAPFQAGAVDRFRLHCAPLGELLKVRVYHNSGGPSPAWLLEEVRVRRQGSPRWTCFPCGRWLAVDREEGRVMRELLCGAAAPPPPAAAPPPSQPPQQPHAQPTPQLEEAAAKRVQGAVSYSVAVLTADAEGAGLAPEGRGGVSLVLHGSRGSSARVRLPCQPGDFERGQRAEFRVQLPGVGALERLTVALGGGGDTDPPTAWMLEQVEVTDESAGETTFFPCSAWLGQGKGPSQRTLLGSSSNPQEARLELGRLRRQLDAAAKELAAARADLAAAQAELAAARGAATRARLDGEGHEADWEVQRATLQAQVAHLEAQFTQAKQRAAAAEGRAEQLQAELLEAAEQARALRQEQAASRERLGADAGRAAELAAQARLLGEQLAAAQEAAAAAAARAGRHEAEARRAEEELRELRGRQERGRQEGEERAEEAERPVRQLRAEAAARAGEVREAQEAEAAAVEECERLSRELALERLRAKAAREQLGEELERAAAAPPPPPPGPAPTSTRLASYRVAVHTSTEPAHAGTRHPVCLELLGSDGSSGHIRLGGERGGAGFGAGSTEVYKLEAPAVGDLQQLNVWLDLEGRAGEGDAGGDAEAAAGGASWHLDCVEVACGGRPPVYFVCRRWLDAASGHRVELGASSRNPRQEEAEYRVLVHTSSLAGCGTGGNVFVDLRGEKGPSGVLTLRNKGGSFRPGQADEFTFRLPQLGALSELRVGHDGRKDWHLDKVEAVDVGSGTTYFFPCAQWVKGSGPGASMPRSLQLRGYTTDPASLPVQYRLQAAVEEVAGHPAADSLRLVVCGGRGESAPQRLDASRAAAGRTLTCLFEADNVGQIERLRIGLAAGQGGQACGVRLSSLVLTNMPSGECATFHCPEWLRSTDPYDLELEAAEEQEEAVCRYRLEVQTSDVRRAGTAANVYVTLVGDAAVLGPYQLPNTEAEHFQRGQLDVFEVEGAPDCGQLRQIEVRHDGAGRANDWHLAWLKVTNTTTGALAMFKCKRWVDRRRREDPGAVGAAAALPPDAAAAAGGRLDTRDRLLLLDGKKAAMAAAAAQHAPRLPELRMSADLGGGAGQGGEGVPRAAGPEALPGYRVVFHTSRTCGSGTRAKVHFELAGSGGSSGVLHPRGAARAFGAGRVDVFEYPALGALGELQSARVGTDGSGFLPGWHLQLLVVTHLPTGRVWQFSCFNWIDRRVNFTRWLTLDSVQGAGYSYAAAAAASAAKWNFGPQPAVQGPAPATGSGPWAQPATPQRSPSYRGGTGLAAGGGSPFAAPLQSKLQFQPGAGTRPGSPSRLQQQGRGQQWGAGGGAAQPGIVRVGSGVPGSPLIGARR